MKTASSATSAQDTSAAAPDLQVKVLRAIPASRKAALVEDANRTADVRGILNVQGERLDMAYLSDWADRLELRDLLDRLLTRK
jgi:hypothetical protein